MAESKEQQAAEPIILQVTVTPKPEYRARAEELWRFTIEDVKKTEQGRVRYDILFDEERQNYVVCQEYASEQIMHEYMNKPYHQEISSKVKEEGILDHWPEGEEVKKLRRVMR